MVFGPIFLDLNDRLALEPNDGTELTMDKSDSYLARF